MSDLKIEGMDEINSKIQDALKKYPEQCKKGIELSCITIEKKAKQNATASIDTGRLRASITYSLGGDKKQITFKNRKTGESETIEGVSTGKEYESYGIVGTNIEYAPYVELGTKNMSAQPYLLPALYSSKAEILKIFTDVLNNIKL